MFYPDYYFSLLTHRLPDLDFGPVLRTYRLDPSKEEFYFFSKCPEKILDVEVYQFNGLEIHEADSTSFTPKRFLFVKQAQLAEMENLDAYSAQNGFERKAYLYESQNMAAFIYQDGMVFASRSCRKNLGEGPGTKIR